MVGRSKNKININGDVMNVCMRTICCAVNDFYIQHLVQFVVSWMEIRRWRKRHQRENTYHSWFLGNEAVFLRFFGSINHLESMRNGETINERNETNRIIKKKTKIQFILSLYGWKDFKRVRIRHFSYFNYKYKLYIVVCVTFKRFNI